MPDWRRMSPFASLPPSLSIVSLFFCPLLLQFSLSLLSEMLCLLQPKQPRMIETRNTRRGRPAAMCCGILIGEAFWPFSPLFGTLFKGTIGVSVLSELPRSRRGSVSRRLEEFQSGFLALNGAEMLRVGGRRGTREGRGGGHGIKIEDEWGVIGCDEKCEPLTLFLL